jgi:hypothetical protein
MAMATVINSGEKNSSAALATAMSKIRFPIDAAGSLRAVRRRRRPLYGPYALEPANSTGRTDIEGRPFRNGVTLSRSKRAVTMDAIVFLSAGTLVVETKLATLCPYFRSAVETLAAAKPQVVRTRLRFLIVRLFPTL